MMKETLEERREALIRKYGTADGAMSKYGHLECMQELAVECQEAGRYDIEADLVKFIIERRRELDADEIVTPQHKLAATQTSNRQDWRTPQNFLDVMIGEFGRWFLDPCAPSDMRHVIGAYSYTKEIDGLSSDWSAWDDEADYVYANPPYDNVKGWIAKCEEEAAKGCEIILLVPARTDTKWFQVAWRAQAICFWKGRLKFIGAPSSAPFPSAVVYFGDRARKFDRAFGTHGKVVML